MAIIVPNTASTFAAAACVVGSQNCWAWVGFRTGIGASGSAAFYQGNTCTSGCELVSIAASPGQTIIIPQPFNSPCGIYAAGITGGCAIVWLKIPT